MHRQREARQTLGDIADYFLMHDRDIARRVDDSIVRIIGGKPRIMRRARGYAPAPIPLPDGFAAAPPVLAMGGELKGAFCLLRDGQAILSHHMGDLENARTFADYAQSMEAYQRLFEHAPTIVAVDRHPEYLSTKLGRDLAERQAADLAEVQHHHAHIAACLAENGIALNGASVIGVALDGLGYGLDDTLWGGEFLLADYRDCQRLATFKPVAMAGARRRSANRGAIPMRISRLRWAGRGSRWTMPICRFTVLQMKPRAVLDRMIRAASTPAGKLVRSPVRCGGSGGRLCPERVNTKARRPWSSRRWWTRTLCARGRASRLSVCNSSAQSQRPAVR